MSLAIQQDDTLVLQHGDGVLPQPPSTKGTSQEIKMENRSIPLEDISQIIKEEHEISINKHSLLKMSAKLLDQITECCQSDAKTMLPSFVTKFAQGSEHGEFLCLEIGGSTLRVALVRLHESEGSGRKCADVVDIRSWPIVKELKMSNGFAVIRWIAQTAAQVIKDHGVSTDDGKQKVDINTCLTWSFPFKQKAIDRGNILSCGKGFFAIDRLVDCDIGALLRDAFKQEGFNICVKAIVNDTVASLLAGNHTEPSMHTSIVLGTGMNAAIAVPVLKIGPHKLLDHPPEWRQDGCKVLVNMELSLLGDKIFPRTIWDTAVMDNILGNSCYQPLEYLCSGYYLGEIVRTILVWAIQSGALFSNNVPDRLTQPFSFDSSLVSTLGSDSTPSLSLSAAALTKHLGLPSEQTPNLLELRMIKTIAQSVSLRAAAYTAATIHAISNFVQSVGDGEDSTCHVKDVRHVITVGVSGAVFERLPGFQTTCQGILNEMAQAEVENGNMAEIFVLKPVAHGSIIGSALAAAIDEQRVET
ncbi:hypothetical protein BX600DRAFT_518618 [Xylariales sp. PMI_506]|nr:hypothetical protein BX600DRAFT_518618 [Xylariales sp. PMI_506]